LRPRADGANTSAHVRDQDHWVCGADFDFAYLDRGNYVFLRGKDRNAEAVFGQPFVLDGANRDANLLTVQIVKPTNRRPS
jgi:hypothetical protein